LSILLSAAKQSSKYFLPFSLSAGVKLAAKFFEPLVVTKQVGV
jgi:hypothetical protein